MKFETGEMTTPTHARNHSNAIGPNIVNASETGGTVYVGRVSVQSVQKQQHTTAQIEIDPVAEGRAMVEEAYAGMDHS